MRLRSSWGLLVMLSAGAAGAQVDTSAWPVVRMEVLAMDKAGDELALTPGDVEVTEGGRPVTVQSIVRAVGPQSVCIVLDMSGSMYERLVSLKVAAARVLDGLPGRDEVCLVDFSSSSYVDAELTMDREKVKRGLSYAQAQGASALFDTLEATAAYLRRNAKNRSRAIVLMTDGDDNASKGDLAGALKALSTDGAPVVHVLRLEAARSDAAEAKKGRATAAKLARATGGIVYFPKKRGELEASVDELCKAMGNRVILGYTADSAARDGGERRVNVELDKTRLKQKSVVYAAEGYYAPSQ